MIRAARQRLCGCYGNCRAIGWAQCTSSRRAIRHRSMRSCTATCPRACWTVLRRRSTRMLRVTVIFSSPCVYRSPLESYKDEADRFFEDPLTFFQQSYHEPGQLPTHFVMYENVERELKNVLVSLQYRKVRALLLCSSLVVTHAPQIAEIFHAHFTGDTRATRNVVVYERTLYTSDI